MNQIEQLLALADAYANARAWCHLDVTEERRQALRAAIEAALKPGEPVAIVVDAYDTPGLQWLCQHPPERGDRLYTAPKQVQVPESWGVFLVPSVSTLAEELLKPANIPANVPLIKGELGTVDADVHVIAAPQPPKQEPVAWTVAGKVTDWSRDFSAYQTKTYVRPVYVAPQPQPVPAGWKLVPAAPTPEVRQHLEGKSGVDFLLAYADWRRPSSAPQPQPWSEVACPHCNGSGLAEDAPQPQPDHFRDATEKVDDTALLRQALYLIEAWERGAESADYWFEIAALRERLKS
jgi:hypothetical protein